MRRLDHLRDLLTRYRTADPRERVFRERMLALAASGPRALDRDHYDPGHFTASAFVLSPDRRRLLLILHDKLGLWLQPGGHVDPADPDVLAAARREILEEVGLARVALAHEGLFDVDIHDIPARAAMPAHQHYDLRFLFVAESEELRAGSDARDARWMPLERMGELESDASVMRAVARMMAAHLLMSIND